MMRRDLGQRRQAALVTLDGDDPCRALPQQGPGQPARPRPDLNHGRTSQRTRDPGDPGGQVQVHQEILTQRLPGAEPVPSDHVAQRRQPVG
jgi:hypothetical protein